MDQGTSADGVNPELPWYWKLFGILLALPIVLVLRTLSLCLWPINAFTRFMSERRSMRRQGRYLPMSKIRAWMIEQPGTLIVDHPTLDPDFAYAWWTPDDVLAESPLARGAAAAFRQPEKPMIRPQWEAWCWGKYTHKEKGSAYLLASIQGESVVNQLQQRFPDVPVLRTWSGLMEVIEESAPGMADTLMKERRSTTRSRDGGRRVSSANPRPRGTARPKKARSGTRNQ
ncbi:MAG: hypothetical protein EA381_06285 [Planctomycetaceae bacterium]|nr:MAG: hypothetical protein EA381_06285 [Planctomycetaceae bacterium]